MKQTIKPVMDGNALVPIDVGCDPAMIGTAIGLTPPSSTTRRLPSETTQPKHSV